ncbi:hypothetical protein DVH05_004104 [Phytophthora capsici]|nr:hypothetical protein DVH05_004104 [Phytophthora capsici]
MRAEKREKDLLTLRFGNRSEQEEEQHVSSAAVSEEWGLAVVVEGSCSVTLSEYWNEDRDSGTISELMQKEPHPRSRRPQRPRKKTYESGLSPSLKGQVLEYLVRGVVIYLQMCINLHIINSEPTR